jgi:hypothetical protein
MSFSPPLNPLPQGWSLYTLDTGGGYNCFELHDFFISLDSGFRRNDTFAYSSVIPAKAGIQQHVDYYAN